MQALHNLLAGFGSALTPANLFWVAAGVVIGTSKPLARCRITARSFKPSKNSKAITATSPNGNSANITRTPRADLAILELRGGTHLLLFQRDGTAASDEGRRLTSFSKLPVRPQIVTSTAQVM